MSEQNLNARRGSVLAVSAYTGDHLSLAAMFGNSAWNLDHAGSVEEAMSRLSVDPAPVILSETTFPDGEWENLLNRIATLAEPANLIVMAKHADSRLWAEALNLGAYDVLTKPLDSKEVFHVVGLAWRNWIHKYRTSANRTCPQQERNSHV